jgi:uncharacterized protein YcbK (DUF882 family)
MGCPNLLTQRGCYPKRRLHLKRATIHGRTVTLQCAALESLKRVNEALRDKGIPLIVISSYRTCKEQAAIYNSGIRPCARPGESYHNIALAVDCYIKGAHYNETRHAFHAHGWNDFDPVSDSGHFTYRVTG